MTSQRPTAVISLVASLALTHFVLLTGDCHRAELAHERQNAATIRQLERAWSRAYLTGDTAFEACLLTADFVSIRSNGDVQHLDDELALARRNVGKTATDFVQPTTTIQVHGSVAVAYGLLASENTPSSTRRTYFADYYVWSDGHWHVFFAQQTAF